MAREGYIFSDTRNSPQSDYSGRSDGAGLENYFSSTVINTWDGGKSLDVFRARTRSDIPEREMREIEKYMTAKKHEKVEKDGMLEKNIVWNLGGNKMPAPKGPRLQRFELAPSASSAGTKDNKNSPANRVGRGVETKQRQLRQLKTWLVENGRQQESERIEPVPIDDLREYMI